MNPLLEYLSGFVTPQRWQTMLDVLEHRSRYITVVLEDIFQPHNASAVLRSCDAFGVQDVHIIENRNRYRVNPDVELGTSQWLNLQRYHGNPEPDGNGNTRDALLSLKKQGYRIIATAPSRDALELSQLPLEDGPVALVFGTELTGLSETAFELADQSLRISMYGFVESFNISVSAALCLYDVTTRLRQSSLPWKLEEHQRAEILHAWLRRSIKKWEVIEASFKEQ